MFYENVGGIRVNDDPWYVEYEEYLSFDECEGDCKIFYYVKRGLNL
jgi:hypothetical protein